MAEEANRGSAVRQNLLDAGCDSELVEQFFRLQQLGMDKRQICLLSGYRQQLLDEIHGLQKQLDCLDYLLYQMKRGEKNDIL